MNPLLTPTSESPIPPLLLKRWTPPPWSPPVIDQVWSVEDAHRENRKDPPETFAAADNLWQEEFHQRPVYVCELCDMRYFSAKSRNIHRTKQHGPIDGIWHPCHQCDKQFASRPSLSSHLNTAHRRSFLCEECGIEVDSLKGFTYHLRLVHQQKPLFACLFCNYATHQRWMLKKHRCQFVFQCL